MRLTLINISFAIFIMCEFDCCNIVLKDNSMVNYKKNCPNAMMHICSKQPVFNSYHLQNTLGLQASLQTFLKTTQASLQI